MIDLPANGETPDSESGSPPRDRSRRFEMMGIRYGAMNWVGEFSVDASLESPANAKIVVQTERGIELGERLGTQCGRCGKFVEPATVDEYVKQSGPDFFRRRAGKVLRIASSADVLEHQRLNGDVMHDIQACRKIARELDLKMKIVTAEHLLGGERIVFYFRSEERIDFRELVKQLAHQYQTRIEMRQVGARDEARLVADYEVCGRECCCKGFLKKLRPVTMKMAKLQKSTLDPSKVSGRCGRLRCCLRYENEGYEELSQKLPRRGLRVMTTAGIGTIIDRQVLTQLLLIRLDDGPEMAFPLEEIKVVPKDFVPPKSEAPATAIKPTRRRPARSVKEETRETPPKTDSPTTPDAAETDRPAEAQPQSDGAEAPRKRRRRRRRGGRAGADGPQAADVPPVDGAPPVDGVESSNQDALSESQAPPAETSGDQSRTERSDASDSSQKPRRRRRRRRKPREGGSAGSADAATPPSEPGE
jgi:cell fate regulator YaaT (PSP1 superfamily)